MRDFGADTLILGCTHFPIISGAIAKFLPGVTLINPAKEAVKRIKTELSRAEMLSEGGGGTEYFVSDEPQRFSSVAKIFLPDEVDAVKIEIEKY